MRAEVPHLRIIDDALWGSVRARQAKLDAKAKPAADGSTFQSKQRPKSLLSGLLRCGACGGGMSMISATHVGCSNARNKGEAVCANKRTVKRSDVEGKVLDALSTRLIAPEIYAAFVRIFLAEWNSEQGLLAAEQGRQREELNGLDRRINTLVEAIVANESSDALQTALRQAEARKTALAAELAMAKVPSPRLLPNVAELYREKVVMLQEALAGEDAAAARERVRALIDEVRLVPSPDDPKAAPAIEVRGALAAMLALGSGESASAAVQLEKQFDLVAGAGFEPAAFRL